MTSVSYDEVTGHRVVRVSRSTIAAAQARQSLAAKLGLPVPKAVEKIAALGVDPAPRST